MTPVHCLEANEVLTTASQAENTCRNLRFSARQAVSRRRRGTKCSEAIRNRIPGKMVKVSPPGPRLSVVAELFTASQTVNSLKYLTSSSVRNLPIVRVGVERRAQTGRRQRDRRARAAADHPAVRQTLPELDLRPERCMTVTRVGRPVGVRIVSTDMIDVFSVSWSKTWGVKLTSPKVALIRRGRARRTRPSHAGLPVRFQASGQRRDGNRRTEPRQITRAGGSRGAKMDHVPISRFPVGST